MPATTSHTGIADTIVAGRRLGDYRTIREFPGHFHRHPDDIVGYVVRETIRDHEVLWRGEQTVRHGITVWSECGYDVATVEGAARYGDTFPIRDQYRTAPGGYAVVDTLYRCGCRS
jgi:hypothetical protein